MTIRFSTFLTIFCAFILCSCSSEGTECYYVKIFPESSCVSIEPSRQAFIYFSVDTNVYNPRFDPTLSGPDVRIGQVRRPSAEHIEMESIVHVDKGGKRIFKVLIRSKFVSQSYSDKCYLEVTGSDGKNYRSNLFTVGCRLIDEKTLPRTGLPVVRIQADEPLRNFSKTKYNDCQVQLFNNRGKLISDNRCDVRLRGQSSLNAPKLPFLLRFPQKTSVFDLPAHKRWILCASFTDKTMLRNDVSYYISSKTSLRYTPRFVNCELVFNGKHMGNYLLLEQIKVGKERLDISEDSGFMFECDSHPDDTCTWYVPFGHYRGDDGFKREKGTPFVIKYPSDDDITESQKEKAKQFIYDAAASLFSEDYLDPEKGYRRFFDLQSFADYWIVNELAMNLEPTNPNSVFMYKDSADVLYAGPVWDFDFGTYSYCSKPDDFKDFVMTNSAWYERLLSDPDFKSVVKSRWLALRPVFETDVPAYIDKKREYLRKSAELNFAIWNPADDRAWHYGYLVNGDEEMSYDDAIDLMKQNFTSHMATMDSIITTW